ncbi:MAG: C-GCAxxG-C-C family protein [Candidatus Stygibacter australis]|nr:C-GCAxxG-C-C family protein [Candidatus Stygibacter australis]MDP8322725.1 C-GCAxxG-C-C family protein [Candidatus Stygibacter australis]
MMNEAGLKARELGSDYYLKYGICSQCVIASVMEVMDIDLGELLKSAHFLAGGGCLMGDGNCGALAAGELVLGAFLGRTREEFELGKFKERLLPGKQLVEKFQQKYGGVSCNWFRQKFAGNEFDMWQDAHVDIYKKKMKESCAEITGTVAEWVVEIITDLE